MMRSSFRRPSARIGNDTVSLGNVGSEAYGEAGDDQLTGGAGNDRLDGGAGDDTLEGGAGADTLRGNDGNNLLSGGDGADRIISSANALDTIYGGAGDDSITTGNREQYVDGGLGNDTIIDTDVAGTSERDTLLGGDGNDSIVSNFTGTGTLADGDLIDGGAGADTLIGGDANDTLMGGADIDSIDGGAGDDSLDGGTGSDTLTGGAGNDTVLGGDGGDRLYGGAGNDRLEGGAGNDQFYTDAGADTMLGGTGRDFYYVEDGFDGDVIDFGGHEIVIDDGSLSEYLSFYDVTTSVDIVFTSATGGTGTSGAGESLSFTNVDAFEGALGVGGTFDASLAAFDVTLFDYGGMTSVTGSDFNDLLAAYGSDPLGITDRYYDGGAGNDTIDTGDGNDTILGGDGNDDILARDGDDSIDGGRGNDTIYGGEGADTIAGGDGDDFIVGGDGDDFLTTGLGNDTLIGGDGNDTLMNSDGDDSLVGGAGNDGIVATGGDDTLEGGDGNDTLDGGEDNDSLDGGSGDDSLDGGTGSDFIEGGSGSDTLSGGGPGAPAYTDVANGNQSAVGTTGQDYFRWLAEPGSNARIFLDDNTGGDRTGDGAADFVLVETTNDTGTLALRGFDYGLDKIVLQEPYTSISIVRFDRGGDQHTVNATITYANGNTQRFSFEMNGVGPILADQIFTTTQPTIAGNDTLSGGDDADTFIVEDSFGNDIITGGEGTTNASDIDADTIDGGALSGDVTVSFTGDEAGTITDGTDTITFSEIENVFTGSDDDVLDASGDIDGGDDADTFVLADGFGNDTIIGGEGGTDDDVIDLSNLSGPVTVTYSGDEAGTITDGTDTITFSGIERLILTEQADVVDGFADTVGIDIDALGGDDSVQGGDGADRVDGGTGNDTVFGWGGDDTLIGGEGNDSLDGDEGADSISGGIGSDTLIGDGGQDTLSGGEGADQIFAGADNDSVLGGAGNDELFGQSGDDLIEGGTGGDTVFGGDGQDTVLGQDGHDSLYGGAGRDEIDGGADNDLLDGQGGEDTLFGGDGNDTIFGGSDASADTIFGGAGDDSIGSGGGNDQVEGGIGNDWISGNDGDDTVRGGEGDDSLYGATGNDALFGDAGADRLEGWVGEDTLDGGDGDDYLDGANDSDTLIGGAGNDTLLAGNDAAADYLDGGEGADVLSAGGGDDTLLGGAGNDSMFAADGDDSLEGGSGNDTLEGRSGNDTLAGGTGDDRLVGGAGDDVFVYAPGDGDDTITDFNTGNTGTLNDGDATNNDSIDLSAFYDDIWELHADQADDGILNQSNDGVNGVDYANNSSFGAGSLTFQGASADNNSFTSENTGVVCFASGTAIRTPMGEVLVEALRAGDLVTTPDHGPSKVLWIGCTEVALQTGQVDPSRTPVRIKPDVASGERALLVSPQHCLLMTDATGQPVLTRARHLAEETRLAAYARGRSTVTFWHVLLEQHSVLISQGRPSESFYPGPNGLAMMAAPERARLLKALPALQTAPVETAYGLRALKVLTRSEVRNNALTDAFLFASPQGTLMLSPSVLRQSQISFRRTCVTKLSVVKKGVSSTVKLLEGWAMVKPLANQANEKLTPSKR